jgi:hypothetical protein
MLLTKQKSVGVVVEVISSSEREIAAQRWQSLEARIGSHALKSSWSWINTWLDYFGKDAGYDHGMPYTFVFGVENGQDIGAALVPISSFDLGAFTVPTIAFGTAGEPLWERTYVQYNRLLVDLNHINAFAQSLVQYVARQRWSVLWIESFVVEHAEALIKACGNIGMDFEIKREVAPTFDFSKLSPDEEIWQGISHDQRSKIRRSMKLFNTQFGACSVEWATTREQALDILEELTRLHTSQWRNKGNPGAFRTQRLRQYHCQLVETFFPDHLIAFRVKQGDTTIGCLCNLVEDDGGHITNHRSGLITVEDNRLKPGYVTNLLFMQEARKRGYSEFDFLDGHVAYKKHLTNAEHTLVSIEAYKGLRSKVYRTARDFYRRPAVGRWVGRIKAHLVREGKI